MKTIIIKIVFLSLMISLSTAQDKKVIDTEIKVLGNCNMCKERIEKAVSIKEVKYKKWNKNSKILKLSFESTVTLDSLQKRIAEVGHDTGNYKAKDEVYKTLPKCCLYRDFDNTH